MASPSNTASILSERKAVTQNGRHEISLARVVGADTSARAWRITLARIDRADDAAPMVPFSPFGSSAIWQGQQFAYANGSQGTPANPPTRDNQVMPAVPTATSECFAQIAWGMSGARLNRLVAHWPAQGGSITVVGANVEVWGAVEVAGQTPPTMPVFQATIAPAAGMFTADAGELSLYQSSGQITPNFAEQVVLLVPDFTRRVRVTGRDPGSPIGNAVPSSGYPRIVGEWLNDRGGVIGGFITGSPGAAEWELPPPMAVLLRLGTPGPDPECGETWTEIQPDVHWRIAP